MSKILEELWQGNIVPQEESVNNSNEMKELMEYIARHHDDLKKGLTDKQDEILEKYIDCWSEYTSLSEKAIFIYAFKLGARFTIEMFLEKNAC